MKILVTGGAGFIGSHIVEYLVQRGDSVTVVDNLNTGKIENLKSVFKKINFAQIDIRDFKVLKNLMENIDGIFHQAAMASVQDSFRIPEKFHDVNVNGTENIFKIAKEFGIKVVYASSSSVYGDTSILPTTESDEKRPINPYAKTKLEKDKLAEQYAKNGLKVIGLRYFNVFGPRQSKEYAGVIKLFLERIQQGLPPLVNGDGLQIRDFVYVDDVVNANILSMESDIDFEFFSAPHIPFHHSTSQLIANIALLTCTILSFASFFAFCSPFCNIRAISSLLMLFLRSRIGSSTFSIAFKHHLLHSTHPIPAVRHPSSTFFIVSSSLNALW